MAFIVTVAMIAQCRMGLIAQIAHGLNETDTNNVRPIDVIVDAVLEMADG